MRKDRVRILYKNNFERIVEENNVRNFRSLIDWMEDFNNGNQVPPLVLFGRDLGSNFSINKSNVKIKNGDFIIMVSDGIVDAGKNNDFGENWLIYFLKKLTTTNPKEIANQILDRALELQLGEVDDDMTVLVTKVISN